MFPVQPSFSWFCGGKNALTSATSAQNPGRKGKIGLTSMANKGYPLSPETRQHVTWQKSEPALAFHVGG